METTVSPANQSVFDGGEEVSGDPIGHELHLALNFYLGLIAAVISIAGIGSNMANLATFVRMGFQDTINISLTALAATDMASLLCLLWRFVYFIPQLNDLLSDTVDLPQFDFITASFSKAYVTTVAGFITSLIAVERCLCVLMPLKVKVLFTRERLVRVVVAIYVLVLPPFLPICFTTRLGPVFRPDQNRTIISLIQNRDLLHIDGICFMIMVCQYISCYVIVFISTLIIVLKLASQSAWRAAKTSENAHQAPGCANGSQTGSQAKDVSGSVKKKAGAVSGRDRRATKTVTFVAVMYIVCSFPAVVLQLLMAFVPQFNKGMLFNNTFGVSWAVAYLGEGICSSANILVYLKTSAIYKEAFLGLFCSRRHREATNPSK